MVIDRIAHVLVPQASIPRDRLVRNPRTPVGRQSSDVENLTPFYGIRPSPRSLFQNNHALRRGTGPCPWVGSPDDGDSTAADNASTAWCRAPSQRDLHGLKHSLLSARDIRLQLMTSEKSGRQRRNGPASIRPEPLAGIAVAEPDARAEGRNAPELILRRVQPSVMKPGHPPVPRIAQHGSRNPASTGRRGRSGRTRTRRGGAVDEPGPAVGAQCSP